MTNNVKIIVAVSIILISISIIVFLMMRKKDLKTNKKPVEITVTGDLKNGTELFKIIRFVKSNEMGEYIIGDDVSFAVVTESEPVINLSIDYVKDSILVFQTSSNGNTLNENGVVIDENIRVTITRENENLAKNLVLLRDRNANTYDQVLNSGDVYSEDERRKGLVSNGVMAWHGKYRLLL